MKWQKGRRWRRSFHPVRDVSMIPEAKTRNWLRVAFESGKGVKVKVVKWCWKKVK